MSENERIPIPQEIVDNRTEALNAHIGHMIGAIALIDTSVRDGRPVNEILTEQVQDGSLTREDARNRADAVRALVHSAHVEHGGVEGVHDRVAQTLAEYRQGPIPQEDAGTLQAMGRERIDVFDRQINQVNQRTTY